MGGAEGIVGTKKTQKSRIHWTMFSLFITTAGERVSIC